jgi:hypothetical protein
MKKLPATGPHGLRPRVLPALVLCLVVAACGKDSAGPGDDGALACVDVQFAQTSGMPLDEVSVGRLPVNFQEPYAARMIGADGSSAGFALVRLEESGDAHLIVPVHPVSPVEGGTVQLALTDGTRECAPVSFTVQPLPAAEGELAVVVGLLRDLFREQAALLGTTPEEMLAANPEELPLVYHPLALVQMVLEHPDNERSLLAIAEGSSPLADAEAITIVDRVLARIGLRASLGSAGSAAALVGAPSLVDDPASECTAEYIGSSAARLDACMALALSITLSTQGAAAEVLDYFSEALAVLGLVPHPAVDIGAAIAGYAVFTLQSQRNRLAALLPSFLADMSVDFRQTDFLEDEVGPGSWANAEVLATNDGWDMGKAVIEEALATAGYGRALEKYGGAKALNDLMIYLVTQDLIPWLLGDQTLEEFYVDPVAFGPVDVTSDEWSEARVAMGDAIEFFQHQIYDLKKAGTATISVRTEDGKFGGQQIAEFAEITIGTLSLSITPLEIVVEPGEVTFFIVTVSNSAFPSEVAIDATVTLQGEADITYEGGNTHRVSYTAPAEPNPDDPDKLTVRHTTTQGARGGGAPPRNAIATIRFGGVEITTEPTCVEPGSEPFQIEAKVAGGIENTELVWTASAGSITESGVFTPPLNSGFVTITAALASDPDIKDWIELQVGGCSCRATINLDGQASPLRDLRFRLSADRSGVESFAWRGGELDEVGFWFGTDYAAPQVIPFNTTGQFDAMTQGILGGQVFVNPDDFDEPTIAPLMALITDNTGSIFAGGISGAVSVAADPEPRIVPFSIAFYMEADPILSDDEVKFCEVPE